MMISRSESLFNEAQEHIPGGVNSPVRAFRSVGGTPIFIRKAKGAFLFDEDGNAYVDFINSWGPMILGHAWEPVLTAIREKVGDGTSFGAPTELEIRMASLLKSMAPGVDLVRMVSSGTEACMSAIRLARGYTGKNKFIKFDGCYHGHADPFLVKAGSGVATQGIEQVPGITEGVANDTLIAPFNNLEAVYHLVERFQGEIAAIIVEPVGGNMGCIPPAPGFLAGLRKICDDQQIVLIFDEVMTGFRLAAGGAQELYGVKADLVTYGKIIGAGLPVGAFGGRRKIMEHIAPLGKVYQAGTLSGNPLAMIAGYTMLKELKNSPEIYTELNQQTRTLAKGIVEIFRGKSIPVKVNQVGSMISVHFTSEPVTDFASAAACDIKRFSQYFHHMLKQGIYLPPSAFESWFVSRLITTELIDKTLEATRKFIPND